jgi:hypothetical protein
MAWIPGTDRNDTLTDSDRDDFVSPLKGDDVVTLGGGHDMIEINPGDGHDTLVGFQTNEDTLVVENFSTIFNADKVIEYTSIDQAAGTITLDLSAAAGQQKGTQTITLTQGHGIDADDILINRGAIPFPETLDLSLLGPADPLDPDFFPYPPDSPEYHVNSEEPTISIGRAPEPAIGKGLDFGKIGKALPALKDDGQGTGGAVAPEPPPPEDPPPESGGSFWDDPFGTVADRVFDPLDLF